MSSSVPVSGMFCVTCKSLNSNHLALFRAVYFATLKSAKELINSRIRVARAVRDCIRVSRSSMSSCIASVYRVRVCIRVCVCVSRSCIGPCQHPRLHIRYFLLHIRQILTGWKLLPQHPRSSMSLVVSLVMSSVMSLVVSLVMWGECDSMIILRERDRHPFLHQS